MYIPKAFQVDDPEALFSLLQEFSFATLVSVQGGVPVASHLPFLLRREEQGARLLGHMARANPQWKTLADGGEVLVIFQGPHGYVSPSWYVTQPSVPTWNYAAVHAYCGPRLIQEPGAVIELLLETVTFYESGFEKPWEPKLPEDYLKKMAGGVVAFELRIHRLEGQFKLSQNRSPEDRASVISTLSQSETPLDRQLAALMAHPPPTK